MPPKGRFSRVEVKEGFLKLVRDFLWLGRTLRVSRSWKAIPCPDVCEACKVKMRVF